MQLSKVGVRPKHLVHVKLIGKIVEVPLAQALRIELHLAVITLLATRIHLLLHVLVRDRHLPGEDLLRPALRYHGRVHRAWREVHYSHHLLRRVHLWLVAHHLCRIWHILVRHWLLRTFKDLHLVRRPHVLLSAGIASLSILLESFETGAGFMLFLS